jgi:hypothetical protein
MIHGPFHFMAATTTTGSRFLTVDLEIISTQPVDAITSGFGARVVVLHVGRRGRRYMVHLEWVTRAVASTADRLILHMVRAIEALPLAADDDPSGIATYSIAGAQFGMSLLWTAPYRG